MSDETVPTGTEPASASDAQAPIDTAPVVDLEESEAPDTDLEEVEHEGEKYRIPKKLKSAMMFQADYTRKTQEIAEMRKALAAERRQVQEQAKHSASQFDDVVALRHADKMIEQYNRLDWNALEREDFVQAQARFRELQQWKDYRASKASEISGKLRQTATIERQQMAKQLAESSEVVRRDIPGWGPELAKTLTDFAKSDLGLTDEQLDRYALDPGAVKTLHRAYLHSQASKAATAKPPAQPITPLTVVRKSAPSQSSVDWQRNTNDMDEWVRKRNAQLDRRAKQQA
jgi:hypothetical protein